MIHLLSWASSHDSLCLFHQKTMHARSEENQIALINQLVGLTDSSHQACEEFLPKEWFILVGKKTSWMKYSSLSFEHFSGCKLNLEDSPLPLGWIHYWLGERMKQREPGWWVLIKLSSYYTRETFGHFCEWRTRSFRFFSSHLPAVFFLGY